MHRSHGYLAVLAVVPLFLAGCGSGGKEQFVPKPAAAKQALTAALDLWKSGQPMGTIADRTPKIEIIDSQWRTGKTLLTAYEIISEDATPDGHHRFKVKLSLGKPAAVQEAYYVVLGKDPLWVYREDDYKKISGM